MITNRQYATALHQATAEQKPPVIAAIINNWLRLLADNNAWQRLESIIAEYQLLWQEEHSELNAQLITREQLPAEILQMLTAYLQQQTGYRHINWETTLEPELLGGFIIKYRDQVIDGSLRSNLQHLKHNLAN